MLNNDEKITSVAMLIDYIFKQKKPYVNAMTIIYKLQELQRHLETKKKYGLTDIDLLNDKLIRDFQGQDFINHRKNLSKQ